MLQYMFSEKREASPLTSLPRLKCDFQVMNFPSVSLLFSFTGWFLCVIVLFLKKLKCAIWLKVSFFFSFLFSVFCGSCYRC